MGSGPPAAGQAAHGVTHRFVNDLAYAEIARIIGCSKDAARRNVREGLKRLRGDYKT